MAAVKFLKGSEEWMMFMDFWKLCQEYWEPEDNQEYWKGVSEAVVKFGKTYGEIVFARMIALVFLDFIEDKAKKMGIHID